MRVKDVDFERRELIVRNGQGDKGRVTVLPENLILPLRQQIGQAKARNDRHWHRASAEVWLPDAVAVTYPRINS